MEKGRDTEGLELSIGAQLCPHVLHAEEVCRHFAVSPSRGLSEDEVLHQRQKFGLNELSREEKKSLLTLFLEQFEDLLARVLLGAAVVSFLLAVVSGSDEGWTAFVEPVVILAILILNAIVSVLQEMRAENSLAALKELQPEVARVLRASTWTTVPAIDLVPGDIIEIRVGDKVPADARVVKVCTVSLRVEQSQLTGEGQAVPKEAAALPAEEQLCELQAKTNMLFSSTTIANGRAIAVVTGTGMDTEIGKIQAAVQSASDEEEMTPLTLKLNEFGAALTKVIAFICCLVWVINIQHFSDPEHGGVLRGCVYYFKTAVALAVAAIPEGLTAVITTCLALGTKKMAQKNAIVRRLPSVETLGCTTVICSDKTGTLTTNEMCVVQFACLRTVDSMEKFLVEGSSFSPVGRIYAIGDGGRRRELPAIDSRYKRLIALARCAALCNDAKLSVAGGRLTKYGEPTEAALVTFVEKLGCSDFSLNEKYLQKPRLEEAQPFTDFWRASTKRVAVLEFSRERKSMSVLCRDLEHPDINTQYVKGAPESILDRCSRLMLPDGQILPISSPGKRSILDEVERMAQEALRVLALAVRYDCDELATYDGDTSHPAHRLLADPENFASLEKDLVFLGIVGLFDPPRPEVKNAIRLCKAAGIRVVMITGDNRNTAEAIASQVGIFEADESPGYSFTGKEFDVLPDADKLRILGTNKGLIFSRTEPKHKQTIIKYLRQLGEITAMTGDGVNDAPALKQADIGIAMGITGTEVAKEASDMVLADDNFSTIVHAVEEGRSIYNNMKAFIRYLISSNIGEVASIFFTAALGIPEGLAPVQLLWVNLVTDGLPATALGFNPPDVDVMTRPPRRRNDPLISGWVFFRYLVIGLYVGMATVGIFIWWYLFERDGRHTLITYSQLTHWGECKGWNSNFAVNPVHGMRADEPCSYFTTGKIKASTLSLTVLVVIEMFNALNALSEDGSLLQMPPWVNPWLVLAVSGSILVHCGILYVPILARTFGVVPLSLHDWCWVVLWSFPVIVIDEVLKAVARRRSARSRALQQAPKKSD